jgi:hypothetical protein
MWVLVASSPLYQLMDTTEHLGYEVCVYAQVPDMGNGLVVAMPLFENFH